MGLWTYSTALLYDCMGAIVGGGFESLYMYCPLIIVGNISVSFSRKKERKQNKNKQKI